MTSSMSHGNRSRRGSSKLSLSTRFVCTRTSLSIVYQARSLNRGSPVLCTKKDYGLHRHLFGAHIFHKHLILCLHLVQIFVPRSLRKILGRPFLIITSLQHSTNSVWVGVLIRTVCPWSRHWRFPSELPAASTSTRVSVQPPTEIRCIRFCKKSYFVTGHSLGQRFL
jgi:hypothetical protein